MTQAGRRRTRLGLAPALPMVAMALLVGVFSDDAPADDAGSEPTFIECTAAAAVIHDNTGRQTRIERGALASSHAFQQHLHTIAATDKGVAVFLVREDGVRSYYVARSIARTHDCPHGKLPFASAGPFNRDAAMRGWNREMHNRKWVGNRLIDIAPARSKELLVFCRDGRVYPADEQRLMEIAKFHAEQSRPAIDDKGRYDCDEIREHFARRSVGDAYFRLGFEVHNHQPFVVFDRLPESGVTLTELRGKDSKFSVFLADHSNVRYHIRFRVWPDSFEVYDAAREIADRADWFIQWEPQSRTDEWKVRLDDIACTGMRAPNRGRPDAAPRDPVAPPHRRPDPTDLLGL